MNFDLLEALDTPSGAAVLVVVAALFWLFLRLSRPYAERSRLWAGQEEDTVYLQSFRSRHGKDD